MIDSGLVGSGRGAARAEDAQGTPTQSHVSPSILGYGVDRDLGGSVVVHVAVRVPHLGIEDALRVECWVLSV